MSARTGTAERGMLLRRGLMLEYLTISWNVVGTVVLLIAAAAARVRRARGVWRLTR